MPEHYLRDLLVNLGLKGVRGGKKQTTTILSVMEQMIELQFSGSALTLSIVN